MTCDDERAFAAPSWQSVVVPPGPTAADVLLPVLAAALDATGPPVLPLAPGPEGDLVHDALAVAAHPLPDAGDGSPPALVVPTSGSTGTPKGVVLSAAALRASTGATHARLAAHATAHAHPATDAGAAGPPGMFAPTWLLAMPAHRVAGVQVLVRSVLAGTRPTVMDLSSGFRPEAFATSTTALHRAAGSGPYATALVPTQLVRLLDDRAGLAALRAYDAVLLGGAAAPRALLDRAREAGVHLVTTYGMSETAGGCVYDGVPLDGVQVRLDDEGRVSLGGPVVFSGYARTGSDEDAGAGDATTAGDPALTVEDGVRWHHTRDLGRFEDDGTLTVLGRVDDVVVTGGEKVAAAVVEDALSSHPGVGECAVIGRPDSEWGERVVAVVVPTDPASPPSRDALRAHVAARVGPRAAPRDVELVDALPLLPSGKVDRRALRGR